MKPTKFFIVWNRNGSNPEVTHKSFEDAKNEAERLSLVQPDDEFVILASVGSFRTKPLKTKYQSHKGYKQ